jgi:hypothetical protein
MKRRPYTKEMAWAYNYYIDDNASTKTELKLRRQRYTNKSPDKIIKNPFQKTGWVSLFKKK